MVKRQPGNKRNNTFNVHRFVFSLHATATAREKRTDDNINFNIIM